MWAFHATSRTNHVRNRQHVALVKWAGGVPELHVCSCVVRLAVEIIPLRCHRVESFQPPQADLTVAMRKK